MNQNRSSNINWLSGTILFCIFIFSACGYQVGNTRADDVRSVGSLAIPLFRNLSFETEAGEIFTEAARRVFAMRGGFKLKPEGKASYVLKGRILSADNYTAALKSTSGTTRSGVMTQTLQVELRLEDSTGSLIKESRIIDKADSLGGEYPTDTSHNRHSAMRLLAEEMMQRAYNEIVEGF